MICKRHVIAYFIPILLTDNFKKFRTARIRLGFENNRDILLQTVNLGYINFRFLKIQNGSFTCGNLFLHLQNLLLVIRPIIIVFLYVLISTDNWVKIFN